jgi:hypothetical protein
MYKHLVAFCRIEEKVCPSGNQFATAHPIGRALSAPPEPSQPKNNFSIYTELVGHCIFSR